MSFRIPVTPSARIDQYLAVLNRALAGLPPDEREDIVREARSHILERAGRHEGDLDIILQDMGPPELYANSFLDGRLPPIPVGSAGRWTPRAFLRMGARVVAAFLSAVGGLLAVIATYKLFWPSSVGVWQEPPLNPKANVRLVFRAGIDGVPPGDEVLGYWLIPIAGLLASLFFVIARGLVRSGRRHP
jgi:hypothetical protein